MAFLSFETLPPSVQFQALVPQTSDLGSRSLQPQGDWRDYQGWGFGENRLDSIESSVPLMFGGLGFSNVGLPRAGFYFSDSGRGANPECGLIDPEPDFCRSGRRICRHMSLRLEFKKGNRKLTLRTGVRTDGAAKQGDGVLAPQQPQQHLQAPGGATRRSRRQTE